MKIDTLYFEKESWRVEKSEESISNSADIVFVFGEVNTLKHYNHSKLLKELYPNATIVGTSSAGNILDDSVSEFTAVATAVSFNSAKVSVKSAVIHPDSIKNDSQALMKTLEKNNLKHIFVLAQLLGLNGTDILKGFKTEATVPITGGFAADDTTYEETVLFVDEVSTKNMAIIIGFYGESLHFEMGSSTGWEEFGATRVVTKVNSNTVYEIDNRPALELYEKYLGEFIKDLPGSGLNFPLSIKTDRQSKNEVIRVMMRINEDKSITFAGDVPLNSEVRLMKTNIDNLIDSAASIATSIKHHNEKKSLTLAISCIGRRSVLKQLVDEEIDAMHSVLPKNTQLTGFYSYGEIAPFSDDLMECKLHNQTMTLTTIYED